MRKSCLIVDDSPTIRKISRRMMAGFGYEVDEAENGASGVEKCACCMPDVVLLDWNMPVMNGLDFLKNLRAMEGGSAPYVVFCTTESDVDHIREAFTAGANEYLMKPFHSDSLREKLPALEGVREPE